jgi:hypothetical protein
VVEGAGAREQQQTWAASTTYGLDTLLFVDVRKKANNKNPDNNNNNNNNKHQGGSGSHAKN